MSEDYDPNQPPRILGIDPGLRLCGYGVIDYHPSRPRLLDAGVIRMKQGQSVSDRLLVLERELTDIIAEHRPRVLGVEQVFSHTSYPRTAIIMGHARGVILLCAARAGLRVVELAPARVKQSMTGNGRATKRQMQTAVQRQWNLPELPEPPDVADALAVALGAGRAGL